MGNISTCRRSQKMTLLTSKSIKHLGTLHGRGTLLSEEGRELGPVAYEIDGYVDGDIKSANGQIEGENLMLDQAIQARDATLVLESGRLIQVVVSDRSVGTAEVRVTGGFPL
jgi:hypothetical protein